MHRWAVVTAAGLAVAGAMAAVTTFGVPAASAGGSASYRALCPPVGPGYARCFADVATAPSGALVPSAAPAGYGPADLASAYNLPSGGTGMTVGIVDAFNAPNAETDMNTYRSTFGIPACTSASGCFTKVDQTGGTHYPPTGRNNGWEGEISLDLDMVSAVCPNCHIVLVEATANTYADLAAGVDEAVALGANAVSNSYGGTEFAGDATYAPSYSHPGVAITASTGDLGFGVQVPAAFATVTAVGGTSLVPSGTARGWTETAWAGAGSGCSITVAKPPWQTDTGCAGRVEADVSAVADPSTGVAVYDTGLGGFVKFGGTSAASPIVASAYALGGQTASVNDGSAPWRNPGDFFDVTSGSNGTCTPTYLCTAAVGYDGPTGWGTPDGVAGLSGSGSAGTPVLTVASSHTGHFARGQTGDTYTVHVANTGGAATTGKVTVVDALPAGLTATAIGGVGWACVLTTRTCSRTAPLNAGSAFPDIVVTVKVTLTAGPAVINKVTVSGGGSPSSTATDPTTIDIADVTIALGDSGNFVRGQAGSTYTLQVSNTGTGGTVGKVTVVDTVPGGLTATAMSGSGWTCTLSSKTCRRTDPLAANTAYPDITLTVRVSATAPSTVIDRAKVSGGAEATTTNDTASDTTTVA